jgi:hypothetical protein
MFQNLAWDTDGFAVLGVYFGETKYNNSEAWLCPQKESDRDTKNSFRAGRQSYGTYFNLMAGTNRTLC